MKNKDEIKLEIYELAQKISRASSEKFLIETTRELFEKSVLLKYASDEITSVVVKEEEKTVVASEEIIKPEPQPVKQTATADLFSSESTQTEAPATPTPLPEKPAPKERKEPKKKATESVAEKLQHNKITDLKASIGINEKFQFINELFEGNMKEYNVAVDQINSFASHEQAESYIVNLEDVYKWQPDNKIAENFKELVKRRFA
jgi:hypothetical protein